MLVLTVVSSVEVNKKALYSEFAIANESATVTCILTETQRQRSGWALKRKKEHYSPVVVIVGMGSWRHAN